MPFFLFFSHNNLMKRALVIGGSSGIGLAIIDKLLEKGYQVTNISRRVCPRTQVESHEIDVEDKFRYEKALFDICQKNKPNLLIYSAGYSMAAEIQKVRQRDYRYLFEVNFFAVLTAIRIASASMKEKGGRIIVISSVGGVMPILYDPYYSASKAAVDMLCFSLRAELERENIYITSLLPGGTRTAFTYKRNVYKSKDLFLNNAVKRLYLIEQNGITAEKVALAALKIMRKKNPPIIYGAGILDRLSIFARKILPEKIALYFIKKLYYKV